MGAIKQGRKYKVWGNRVKVFGSFSDPNKKNTNFSVCPQDWTQATGWQNGHDWYTLRVEGDYGIKEDDKLDVEVTNIKEVTRKESTNGKTYVTVVCDCKVYKDGRLLSGNASANEDFSEIDADADLPW